MLQRNLRLSLQLHGVTSQKAIILTITAVFISDDSTVPDVHATFLWRKRSGGDLRHVANFSV